MKLGLKNKIAIITGANNPQGIGAATCYALAREGVNIVIAYKDFRLLLTRARPTKTGLTATKKQTMVTPQPLRITCVLLGLSSLLWKPTSLTSRA